MAEGFSDTIDFNSSDIEQSLSLVCQSCNDSGDYSKAKGFCQDCDMYLCAECIKYHARLPVSRNHTVTILNEGDISNGDQLLPDFCTDRCTDHGDIINYYCLNHNQFGCTVCVTQEHKTCKIEYIPKVSKDIVKGNTYIEFITKISLLECRVDLLDNFAETHAKKMEKAECEFEEDISKYSTEIYQLVSKIRAKMVNQMEESKTRNMKKVSNISESSKWAKRKLQNIYNRLEKLRDTKQFCKLFVEMKRANIRIKELENYLEEINTNNLTDYKLVWQNSSLLLDTADIKTSEPKHFTCAKISEVNVRSNKDYEPCYISCITMLPGQNGKLVMVNSDEKNYSIKVVDMEKEKLITELNLPSFPWHIAQLQGDKLVVTLPKEKKILVIKWEKGAKRLKIDKDITINDECWGITSLHDKIVFTVMDPAKVMIISQSGETIQSFRMDSRGKKLFSEPTTVVISADGQSMYVSDRYKHSVICLGLDGEVKFRYKDFYPSVPRGLYVDNFGTVFVSGYISENIYILAPDLRKIKVILQRRNGIIRPLSLYLCEDTDKLYVGSYTKNTLEVFQLNRYTNE